MKNSNDAIGQVLAGLRDVEAPDGMEQRIVEGLERRPVAHPRSVWRRLRPLWLVAPARPVATMSLVCSVAFAGLFAIALAIPAIRLLGHAPVQSTPQSSSQSKMNSAPVASLTPAPHETVVKSPESPSPWSSAQLIAHKNASRGKAVHGSDSVALNEMHDASFPAPPMPLTEQEKLLLRIAHKGDPVELAMLDPVVRAARDAEEKAEVKNFFEPPGDKATTKGNE